MDKVKKIRLDVYLVENKYTQECFAMKEIDKTSEDLLTDSEIVDEVEILICKSRRIKT